MPPLNWADYGIVGVIGLSGLIGALRGLVREVFSLAAWGVSVWIGLRYSRELAAQLQTAIPVPSLRVAAAFTLLFLGALAVTSVLGWLVAKLVAGSGLSGADRLAGLLFGLARGVVVVAVLVLLAGVTPLPDDPWWKRSKLIPPFQSLALWLRDQVPADYAQYFKFPMVSRR
ncbi:CvpA family protein [Candidatus Methylocalor cossyra]|uniref:Colicin V production protein n=1 Tax=Candidatus Methylocalor cossyra TaxID=3108543 RepID=A0ABP1C7A6_9GAMM